MHKFLVSALAAAVLLAAQSASAQASYYPFYSYGSSSAYAGACVNLTADLSFGARSSQVTQLQQFLVAQNYPGGGSWMVTGYFGQATVQAVRNFQQSQGLAVSGAADAATRAAMYRVSCQGGAQSSYDWNSYAPYQSGYNSYSYAYPSNNYNGYSYQYQYQSQYQGGCGTYPYYYSCGSANYGSRPSLSSLSTTSAAPGASVTIYGTGFDYSANTVYVGGTTLSGVPSYNGTSLVFTVPQVQGGMVSVTVGNSRGTSNALTFTVTGSGYPYPCQGGYGYYCPPQQGVLSISYLDPSSGAIGSSVTVRGYGFSQSGNTVRFGNGVIANLSSYDGTSLSFTVPTSLSGYGYQPVGLGTYDVSVTNSWGATSNALPFTVTSTSGSGSVSITGVSGPTTLSTGVSGTWTLTLSTGNASYSNVSVNWGDSGGAYNAASQGTYSGTQTLTFSHVYAAPGTYTITFTASSQYGQQATASATVYVTGTGTTGNVTLNSISPTSGRVGTQIMLTGSGFTGDNTIRFGSGGVMHVPSQSGTYLYYTVPSYLSPCDVTPQGGVCAQYVQQVTPGSYQLYVTNAQGTSQTLTFTVTN